MGRQTQSLSFGGSGLNGDDKHMCASCPGLSRTRCGWIPSKACVRNGEGEVWLLLFVQKAEYGLNIDVQAGCQVEKNGRGRVWGHGSGAEDAFHTHRKPRTSDCDWISRWPMAHGDLQTSGAVCRRRERQAQCGKHHKGPITEATT